MRGKIRIPGGKAVLRTAGWCSVFLCACPLVEAEVFARFSGFPGGIPPVTGEATSPGRTGWTQLYDFSTGGSQFISFLGGSTSTGKASLSPLTFSKAVDSLSPALFAACTQGKFFEKLEVEVEADTLIGPIPVYRLSFDDVLIESVNWSGSGGGIVPDESVSCLFASATFQTRQPGPVGTYLDTGYLAYWDLQANEGYLQQTSFGSTANLPPTVNAVPLQTVPRNASSLSFSFSFSDPDTGSGNLTVDAVSLSEALIPDASVTVTGTGLSRTVQFNSADAIGNATIQLSVSDGVSTTTRTVTVAVVNPGTPPSLQLPSALAGCLGIAEPFRGIGIIDPDSTTGFTLVLAVNQGQLDLATDIPGGIQPSEVTGNGSATVTIAASKLAINNTLGNDFGLLYTASLSSNAQLNISLTDDTVLNDTDTLPITVFADPYLCWQLRYFTEAEINGNLQVGELDDYDLDGTLNLIEFATNLDPTNPAERNPVTVDAIQSGADTFLELTYDRRVQPGTLFYSFEIRNPVTGNWDDGSAATTLTGGPDPVNPLIEAVSYQTNAPVDDEATLIRLKVIKF